jgi:hypothetical protein
VLVQRLRGRRARAGRRAQHGRVRVRLHHREHALRAGAQPARPRAHGRRFVGRFRRRRGGRPGAAGAGLRHQRLDPRAGVAVRRVGPQADLRPAVAARHYPFVHSLDHLGPLADSVEALALSYDAMQGADPLDPGCHALRVQPVAPLLSPAPPAAHRRARRLLPQLRDAAGARAVATAARVLGARAGDLARSRASRAPPPSSSRPAEGGSLHLRRPAQAAAGLRAAVGRPLHLRRAAAGRLVRARAALSAPLRSKLQVWCRRQSQRYEKHESRMQFGAGSRRRRTPLRECPPGCGLLLDFAAGSTPPT